MKNLFSIFVIVFAVALFSCTNKDVSASANPTISEASLAPSANVQRVPSSVLLVQKIKSNKLSLSIFR